MIIDKRFVNGNVAPDATKQIVGAISGTTFTRPDTTSGFPAISCALSVTGGATTAHAYERPAGGYPDSLSPTLKIGMFLPSTNTSMEAELWHILKRGAAGGDAEVNGVGIHAANVLTPKPDYSTPKAVAAYNNAFAAGLQITLKTLRLAEPQYLIMGMSFEGGNAGIAGVDALCQGVAKTCGMGLATWQWAIKGALETMFPLAGRATPLRVGLLSPFNESGNANATAFFGSDHFPQQEVPRSFSFSCATTVDIAHVPDDVKRAGIRALVGGDKANPLVDCVVQCGTNCTLVHLADELEQECGVPVLGVNAVLLWFALRENGINGKIDGVGRLFREH